MYEALGLQTTDGEIALINLESARRRAWNRFFADPRREVVAEVLADARQLVTDLDAE